MLVLSQFLEDSYVFDLVADGAQGVGYMLKEKVGNLDMFTDAVRRVERSQPSHHEQQQRRAARVDAPVGQE